MKKKISIIIVTYNSLNQIKECLYSIFKYNDIGDALEVIIVDNGSIDYLELTGWLNNTYGNRVRLFRNSNNLGYGAGNNVGIKVASAPIILIMNPDVRLFMPIMNEAFLSFSEDENMALLGMVQFEKWNKIGQSFLPIIPSIGNLFRLKFYKCIQKYSQNHFCIHGSCFFIRKNIMEEIGGFDENIFLYNEERDLHVRLLKSGYNVKWNKTIGYIHPMHSRKVNVDLIKMELLSFQYVNNKYNWNWRANIYKTYYLNLFLYYKAKIMCNKGNCEYFMSHLKITKTYL